jgi:hypothetical protein
MGADETCKVKRKHDVTVSHETVRTALKKNELKPWLKVM